MGSPIVFSGKRSKLLSSKGLLYSNGSINDYNGDINYILNGHAEVNTAGWATYADAAQATPVNGTGGSANVTWTQTTTAPLDDLASFVFTKDAVNRQGQGVSYDFTIDSASQAKVMTITFDYIIGSGTFTAGSKTTDSDLEVYLYDVTNSVLIQPSTYKLYSNSSTIPTQFIANFQTPYNSTSYRLIFHCATTSASAYTVKFDNVKVSPQQYTYGTPITYLGNLGTITVTAVTSNPTKGTIGTDRITGSRIGNRVLLDYQYQQTAAGSSAAGSGDYIFALPPGMSFDSSIITPYSGAIHSTNTGLALAFVGTATMTQGTRTSVGACYAYSATSFRVWFTAATADGSSLVNYVISSSQSGFTEAATIGYAFNINAAIQGYSSAVQTSDQTSQQVVGATFYQANAQTAVGASFIQCNFDTVTFDATGSVTTGAGAWKYTAPVQGLYRFDYTISSGNTAWTVAGQVWQVALYKNGSAATGSPVNTATSNAAGTFRQTCSGSFDIVLNAGDYIDLRLFSSISSVPFNGAGVYGSVQRISGPSSIAATDTVASRYSTTAGNSVGTGLTTVIYATRDYDITGAYNTSTGVWTAPSAGKYLIAINGDLDVAAGWSMRQSYQNAVTVNATTTYYVSRCWSQAAGSLGLSCAGAIILNLKAGDSFTIQHSSSIASSLTTSPAGMNNFSVNRLGVF